MITRDALIQIASEAIAPAWYYGTNRDAATEVVDALLGRFDLHPKSKVLHSWWCELCQEKHESWRDS